MRLWTRSAIAAQLGHWLVLLVWRTVMTVIAPSWTAFSTWKPGGTKVEGRRLRGMALILHETNTSRRPNFIKSKSEPKLPAAKHNLVDGLGVRAPSGVAYRVTFIIDPDNVIQHVYATNLDVGRAPQDTLRVLDALQTKTLCACNRPIGGEVLKVGP